jgi:ferredoxin-NADP reductase
LPGHSSEQLQRALRIPALSKGWQSSFQALLQQDLGSNPAAGNPGLASEEQPPAWRGFRQMRVAHINKESNSVTSFVLAPTDGQPLPVFRAGQFVVLRLPVDPGKPPVLRSYSLSDLPAADHLRISVKSELNGIGSSFLCTHTQAGDVLEVSAPRGSFTLRPSQSPAVLLSAGVGATPVMSMLHALAAEKSQRAIWWIYGARNRAEHPFAEESRSLLKQLPRGRGYIVYSKPALIDKVGEDFDACGHIDTACWKQLACPRPATSICAAQLHSCRTCAMASEPGVCSPRMCIRKSSVRLRALLLVWRRLFTLLTCHQGRPALALQSHSRVAGSPPHGIVSSRVCLSWPKRATFRSDGRAAVESAIPVSRV